MPTISRRAPLTGAVSLQVALWLGSAGAASAAEALPDGRYYSTCWPSGLKRPSAR